MNISNDITSIECIVYKNYHRTVQQIVNKTLADRIKLAANMLFEAIGLFAVVLMLAKRYEYDEMRIGRYVLNH